MIQLLSPTQVALSFQQKCHWIWLKWIPLLMHLRSFLEGLVYLRMLSWVLSAYNYFVYWTFVRILWCIIQNVYVEDGRRWMVTSLVFHFSLSLSLFSDTHEAWLSSVLNCVALSLSLSLSFSLVVVLILGCCMLGCCVFVRSGTNMER